MVHFHQRFLVTVAMDQNFHQALGWRIVWGVSLQKLAEQKCLASEPVGALVGGKQVMQLIPKRRSATRLQDNNWQSCVNQGSQSTHDLAQIVFGFLQHAEVIKGPPAAQRTPGANR